MQRKIIIAFITLIVSCAAIGIICFAMGSWGSMNETVLLTIFLIGLASVLGLAGSVVWARHIKPPLGFMGMVLPVLALLLSFVPVWGKYLSDTPQWSNPPPWWYSSTLWQAIGFSWVAAVAVPHIGLLLLARLHRRFHWIRTVTIGLIILLAMAICLAVMDRHFVSNNTVEKAIAIISILVALGSLSIPAMHRLSVIKVAPLVQDIALSVQLTCPRCTLLQSMGVGRSACTQCGLRFVIEIEENVCEKCGYPLYRLESANCPECGAAVLAGSANSQEN